MISKIKFSIASLMLIAVICLCTSCGNKSAEHDSKSAKQQPTSCGVIVNVSESIPRYEGDIPTDAEVLQNDMDWIVYKQDLEETYCYTACRLYLENSISGDKYILLETKGENTPGKPLSIKARNKLAYGYDVIGYKDEATYEMGCIQDVGYVVVLAPTKLLIEGIPDCRNTYAYIMDLETYSAIHIEAYGGIGVIRENGVVYLDCSSPDYSSGYRQEYLMRYDLDGNLISREPYEEKDE